MVKVLDLAPPKSGNLKEYMDDVVRQTRAALAQGQAVALVNWEPKLQMKWEWNERDLAELIGGIATDGSPSLKKRVQWQCKSPIVRIRGVLLIPLYSSEAESPRKTGGKVWYSWRRTDVPIQALRGYKSGLC